MTVYGLGGSTVSVSTDGGKSWISLGRHAARVLILDETGDPKRGHRIALAAQQYLGKLGPLANGVVAVTS